jgi:hypothetical protein
MSFCKLRLSFVPRLLIIATVVLPAWNVLGADPTKQAPSSFETAVSLVSSLVNLLTGLAWPVVIVLLLVYIYRDAVQRLLRVIERRISEGAKVSVLGFSVESGGSAPLPPAATPSDYDPAAPAALAESVLLSPGTNVLIALGETSKAGDESAVIGSGDALGLALVQAALLRIHGVGVTATVVRQAGASAVDLLKDYSHVISIGGPRGNRLSSAIMGSAYLTFEFQRGGVYDKQEHKLNMVEFFDDGRNGTDWAILLITGNPLNSKGRAVVLAGYSGYGTNAAAAVFADLYKFKDLHRSGSIEALIRVRISEGIVEHPELVEVRPMPTAGAP